MGDRKQPNPAPGQPGSTAPAQRKPDPPPAPPPKRADGDDRRELDRVRALNAELLAALRLCRSALNEEVIAAGDLDHPTIRAHAKACQIAARAIAKAEGR